MSVYSLLTDGGKLANQSLPFAGEQMTLGLGFKAPVGSYTLNFVGLDILNNASQVYLKDNFSGTLVDLNANSTYAFTVSSQEAINDRFELIFSTESVTGITSKVASSAVLYPNPTTSTNVTLALANYSGEVSVVITDMLGRTVDAKTFSNVAASAELQLTAPSNAGQYIVKVSHAKGSFVRSLTVK
jgi:hypothetical protein